MRITLVGPGLMSIPPTGWGAVEILVHDLRTQLEKEGHAVTIVNTPDPYQIIYETNNSSPDFVHFHYDQHFPLFQYIECPCIAVTSHFCYLDQPAKYYGFQGIFNAIVSMRNVYLFTLAEGISRRFENAGFPKEKIFLVPNGVRPELFSFNEKCALDRSIYLAKIDRRKRQYVFHGIPNLDFAGDVADPSFNAKSKNYLGEWTKRQVYGRLTDYANLILLSDGEAHPLVCMEAMCAGLGLVISEYAAANLDIQQPFIDVIPENMIHDIDHVNHIIFENRKKSVSMRREIRDYVTQHFSASSIVKNFYLPAVDQVIQKTSSRFPIA